ncbi:MAG: hypothetical protein JXQ27_00655 [Acidobacteria bacterium]|nr:hypothetical protein [Acidobacteriota bacterium]
MTWKYHLVAIGILVLLSALPTAAQITTPMGEVMAGDEDYGYWNNVAFTPDGTRGLVTDPQNDRVIIFDPRRLFDNIEAVFYLGTTGAEPAALAIDPTGQHACILNINNDTVTIIRLADYQSVTYIPPINTDFAVWNNIAFTPSGQYGFVCDARPTANRLHIFRVTTTTTNLHHQTLLTGTGPARTYVSPTGDKAFIVCNGLTVNDQITVVNLLNEPGFSTLNTFSVVDADLDRVVDSRVMYNNLVFAPNGSMGYICDPLYNDVVAFGIPDYANQPYLDLPFEGNGPTDASLSRIAVTPDGQTLLVCSTWQDQVHFVDRNTLSYLGRIQDPLVDFDAYNSFAFSAGGQRAFIGSVGSAEVLELDLATGAVLRYLATGAGPETLAVTTDGRFLSSINVFDDNISLFCLNPHIINIPFFRTSAEEYTGYGISNASAEPLSFIATALDTAGQPMNGTSNPVEAVLDPLTQLPFIGGQFFGLPENPPEGWIQIISNSPEARAFFLNTNMTGDYMDGTVTDADLYLDFIVTHVRENYQLGTSTEQTELYLVNPYNYPVDLRLALHNSDGSERAFLQTTLVGGEVFSGTMRELFLRDETFFDLAPAYVTGTVTNDGAGVAGFARVIHREPVKADAIRTMHSLPLQRVLPVDTLYCPHLASGGTEEQFAIPYETVFHILNLSGAEAEITFTLYDDHSDDTFQAVRTLADGEQFSRPAWQLFGLPDPAGRPPYITGDVIIRSDRPGIIGDVIFGDGLNSTPWVESCLALYQQTFQRAVFSHVAHGPADESGDVLYINGISLSNPGDSQIQIQVRVYRETGVLTGSNVVTLPPHSRLLRLLDAPELVPAAWGQLGGYVVAESTGQFVAFELFIDNQNRFMSAVPRN